MVTNKQLQEILKQYDDQYIICIDKAFGWDKSKELVDPHLFIDTDNGQIEIESEEIKDLDCNTTFKIIGIYNQLIDTYDISVAVASNVVTDLINQGYERFDDITKGTIHNLIKKYK